MHATAGPLPAKVAVTSVALVADAPGPMQEVVEVLHSANRRTAPALSLEELARGTSHPPASLVLAVSGSTSRCVGMVRDAKERWPATRLVVLAPRFTSAGVRRILSAGAHGLVLEKDLDRALVATVDAVSAGQLVTPGGSEAGLAPPSLSAREKQALGMVVMGFSNGEIAGRLYLAESTVKSHLSSAFSKLGVGSRNEATALILDPEGGLGPGILSLSPSGSSRPTAGGTTGPNGSESSQEK